MLNSPLQAPPIGCFRAGGFCPLDPSIHHNPSKSIEFPSKSTENHQINWEIHPNSSKSMQTTHTLIRTYQLQNQPRLLDSLLGSCSEIGAIQRRLAWPLRRGDTHKSRSVKATQAPPGLVAIHNNRTNSMALPATSRSSF